MSLATSGYCLSGGDGWELVILLMARVSLELLPLIQKLSVIKHRCGRT